MGDEGYGDYGNGKLCHDSKSVDGMDGLLNWIWCLVGVGNESRRALATMKLQLRVALFSLSTQSLTRPRKNILWNVNFSDIRIQVLR